MWQREREREGEGEIIYPLKVIFVVPKRATTKGWIKKAKYGSFHMLRERWTLHLLGWCANHRHGMPMDKSRKQHIKISKNCRSQTCMEFNLYLLWLNKDRLQGNHERRQIKTKQKHFAWYFFYAPKKTETGFSLPAKNLFYRIRDLIYESTLVKTFQMAVNI